MNQWIRKLRLFLKRHGKMLWSLNLTSLPLVALLVWLNQLDHIQSKTPREFLLSFLPTLEKVATFVADTSADVLRLSA